MNSWYKLRNLENGSNSGLDENKSRTTNILDKLAADGEEQPSRAWWDSIRDWMQQWGLPAEQEQLPPQYRVPTYDETMRGAIAPQLNKTWTSADLVPTETQEYTNGEQQEAIPDSSYRYIKYGNKLIPAKITKNEDGTFNMVSPGGYTIKNATEEQVNNVTATEKEFEAYREANNIPNADYNFPGQIHEETKKRIEKRRADTKLQNEVTGSAIKAGLKDTGDTRQGQPVREADKTDTFINGRPMEEYEQEANESVRRAEQQQRQQRSAARLPETMYIPGQDGKPSRKLVWDSQNATYKVFEPNEETGDFTNEARGVIYGQSAIRKRLDSGRALTEEEWNKKTEPLANSKQIAESEQVAPNNIQTTPQPEPISTGTAVGQNPNPSLANKFNQADQIRREQQQQEEERILNPPRQPSDGYK